MFSINRDLSSVIESILRQEIKKDISSLSSWSESIKDAIYFYSGPGNLVIYKYFKILSKII